jgi:hypothetical protein
MARLLLIRGGSEGAQMMNQQTSRPTTSPALAKSPAPAGSGLGQMADSMKTAVEDFKTIQPSGILAVALSAWKPLSHYGLKAFKFTSVYTRRHPVRIAISVIAIGFVASRLLRAKPAAVDTLKESV